MFFRELNRKLDRWENAIICFFVKHFLVFFVSAITWWYYLEVISLLIFGREYGILFSFSQVNQFSKYYAMVIVGYAWLRHRYSEKKGWGHLFVYLWMATALVVSVVRYVFRSAFLISPEGTERYGLLMYTVFTVVSVWIGKKIVKYLKNNSNKTNHNCKE